MLTTTLWSKHNYPHFTDKQVKLRDVQYITQGHEVKVALEQDFEFTYLYT